MMLKVRGKSILGVMVALAAVTTATPGFLTAQAEEPIATALDTSEVEDYLGMWLLSIDIMGNEIEMFLTFADVGGKLGATLDSARQPEALAISEIEAAEAKIAEIESKIRHWALNVESHEVVHIQACSADGYASFYPGVGAMPIVMVQPVRQFFRPLL